MESLTKAIIFAVLAGLGIGGSGPMLRIVVRKCDPLVGAASIATVGTVIAWAVLWVSGRYKQVMPAIKSGPYAWWLLGAALLLAVVNITLMLAYKYGEVTLVNSVQKPLSVVFAIALGVAFLHESMSIIQAGGVVFVTVGIIAVILG